MPFAITKDLLHSARQLSKPARAFSACNRCRAMKARCSADTRPCTRCAGVECTQPPLPRRNMSIKRRMAIERLLND